MPRQKYNIPLSITFTQPSGTKNVFIRGKELGRGSFSIVYCVVHQRTGKTYAMKVMPKKKYLKSKSLIENLRNEAKIQRIVDHPNVVSAKYSFSDEHNYYFALEYCPGKTIRDYLNKQSNYRLREPEARKILKDVIQGLVYIHSKQITHYDIKLENFIIDSNGNVKIGDFGLSSFNKNEKGKKFEVFGTLNYLSPEMLLEADIIDSQKVDVWAIGISAFYLLTGEGPFEGKTKEITFDNIKKGEFHFHQDLTISNEAKNFIKKILQTDPRKRPNSRELLNHPFLTKIDEETVILYRSNVLPPLIKEQKVQSGLPQISENLEASKLSKENLKPVCCPPLNDNKMISPRRPNTDLKPVCSSPRNDNKIITPRQPKENLNPEYSPPLNENKVITPRRPNTNLKPVCSPPLKENKVIAPRLSNANYSPQRNDIRPISPRIGVLSNKVSPCKENKKQITVKNFDIPNHFVSRYCFYGDDLAYLLIDGTVGICFNNNSRIVMDPNEQFIQFYQNQKIKLPRIIKLEDVNEEEDLKNITLVKKVAKNFKKIKFSYNSPDDEYIPGIPLHNINCFVKDDESILFRLDDKNLQINFNDRMKLIIFWDTKKMCFFKSIREKCSLLDLKTIASMGSNSDELKKFKNAKILLSNMALTIC